MLQPSILRLILSALPCPIFSIIALQAGPDCNEIHLWASPGKRNPDPLLMCRVLVPRAPQQPSTTPSCLSFCCHCIFGGPKVDTVPAQHKASLHHHKGAALKRVRLPLRWDLHGSSSAELLPGGISQPNPTQQNLTFAFAEPHKVPVCFPPALPRCCLQAARGALCPTPQVTEPSPARSESSTRVLLHLCCPKRCLQMKSKTSKSKPGSIQTSVGTQHLEITSVASC